VILSYGKLLGIIPTVVISSKRTPPNPGALYVNVLLTAFGFNNVKQVARKPPRECPVTLIVSLAPRFPFVIA
jgi:hypothetical protein